jgi:hypothetical protein
MTLNADVANKPAIKNLHLVNRGQKGELSYAEEVRLFFLCGIKPRCLYTFLRVVAGESSTVISSIKVLESKQLSTPHLVNNR